MRPMSDPPAQRSERARWSRTHSAALGALLGMAVSLVHVLIQILRQNPRDAFPFAHILLEYLGLTAAGALLLLALAEMRNRLVRAR